MLRTVFTPKDIPALFRAVQFLRRMEQAMPDSAPAKLREGVLRAGLALEEQADAAAAVSAPLTLRNTRRPIFNQLVAPFAGGPVLHDEAKAMLDAHEQTVRAETHAAFDANLRALRTPVQVHAFLAEHLAPDVHLSYQQAIGEEAIAQTVEDAQVVRAQADNEGLYDASWREGWDDLLGRVDSESGNGPYPAELFQPEDAPGDDQAADDVHRCTLPPTRRLSCGCCPHQVCVDCERCAHTCECGGTPVK